MVRPKRKQAFVVGIFFIVASSSFALGYLANREFSHAPIILEKCGK